MILDKQNLFSDDQAVTVTADSTNVIDLGIAGMGKGEPVRLIAQVTETFDGGTSLQVSLVTSDSSTFNGATTLVGIQRSDGAAWFNSLAEFTPDARIGAVYDKFHLVPFGEYIPWGDALARFGITAFAAQHGNGYSRGPGPQLMAVEGLPPFQPLICYEAIFERHLLRDQRPDWILQVTNDAWFGTWSGPYQHLAQARLRSILLKRLLHCRKRSLPFTSFWR